MSQEIGVAYVSLLPSGRGFSKAVQGEFDDAYTQAEKKGGGLFSRLGKVAKGFGIIVGGAVATVGALAVGGGIARALNIEDAQAKLKGLGHDTKSVEAIMKDALASVKGTAFGLDSAATVAASAVAAGIKPGQELERYLRLTADAATIAGTSLDEMGSILNKVTAKGVAQMDDLNRLTERGVPILQWLADEYGVTADELSKMVARGEVDAATFRKVIEENIGGAALASGETTRGAFANMMASLSRFGAALGGPFMGAARDFFNEMILVFDGITSRLKPAFDALQFGIDGIDFDFSDRVLAFLDPLLNAINGFATAAQSGSLKEWVAGVVDAVPGTNLLLAALNALQPILPVVQDLFAAVGDELRNAAPALGDILTALEPLIPKLGEALVVALEALVDILPSLVPLVVALLDAVVNLVNDPATQGFIDWLVDVVKFLATPTSDVFREWADGLGILGGVLDFLADIFEGDSVLDVLDNAGEAFGELFTIMTQPFVDAGAFISSTWSQISAFLSETWAGIVQLATGAWGGLGETLGGILKIIFGLFTGNFGLIKQEISGFLSTVSGWWNQTWSNVLGFVRTIWTGVGSAVSAGVNNAVRFVQGLPGKLMAALRGAASWLYTVGQDIVRGLINGVGSMIQSAVASVQEVGGAMLDGVKSWLGIKSPSRKFRDEVGRWIPAGVMEGVKDGTPQLRSTIEAMVQVPQLSGASSMFGTQLRLVVEEGREFNAYVDSRADGRVAASNENQRQREIRGFRGGV